MPSGAVTSTSSVSSTWLPSTAVKSISQERVLRDNLLGDEKESNITSYTIYDGIMYYTKEKSAAVYRYDILHDVHLESLETDEYEDFLPSRTMISCEVRDSHLILYLANEALYKGTYASVDLDTMQIAPLNLYAKENGEDVFVGIFAEGEKDFLVRVGKFTRKRNDYGTDGTPFTYEQSFEDYVLIRKEDYWNSRPNYLRFKYYE